MTSPPEAPGRDTRFSTIEDAAALLRLLPAAEKIAWPVEPGDVAELDATLRWLGEWLPKARRSWRGHKALLPKRGKLRAIEARP